MKKKIMIIASVIIILITVILILYIYNHNKVFPEKTLEKYMSLIQDEKYEEMYNILSNESKEKYDKETFISRNKNIYEGISCEDIKTEIISKEENGKEFSIKYKQTLVTSAGNIEFENTANLIKEEKETKLNWKSNLIFPELSDTDKVRVSTLKGERGKILDRNGSELAINGSASSIGIVPGKLGENKEENINKISEILGVSIEKINELLSASYVKDNTFVPIRTIPYNRQETKEKLLEIPGVKISNVSSRVYVYGEELSHLIGYVGDITAEELESKKDNGYTSTSVIGKTGLEKVYEERLRATDGKEIYIEDENKNKIKTLAYIEKTNGEDIYLTIDINLQKELYTSIKDDKGLFVAMNPQTGELLALVSTPSYDTNDLTVGMTNSEWNKLKENENTPMLNRYAQKYAPGSTFKPITGAIGLELGRINETEDFGYTGTSWQKDSSWGNYFITTLTSYSSSKNLTNAMMYSDNIYFAKTALKIGNESYKQYLNKIGFNEEIGFALNIASSKYGELETEIKLADSGYGQGDIQVNPIHMASIYSAFANDGNMIKPYIEKDDTQKGTILKENAFSKETANIIKNSLIQVVENPNGTANDMYISGIQIAGKTGTAELKTSKEDTESNTLGWFNCFTVNENQNYLFIGMIEDGRDKGGSHYLISKLKNLGVLK